jgi:DNA-binding transcriptional LysR family regulator
MLNTALWLLWELPIMEMHQVRYFLAVARLLNFTRAAEHCNVTQPSLTRAVQKLEDELGGLLFRRERSLTHLTDLGRMMLPHLEQTYDAAQTAKALAKGMGKEQVAPLSLGVARSIDSDALKVMFEEVSAGLPGLSLSIRNGSTDELIELALKGDLDLVLIDAPDDAHDRLEPWPMFERRHSLVLRADHPLASKLCVTVAELSDEVWIDCNDFGSSRLCSVAATLEIQPRFRHTVEGAHLAPSLIQAGMGVAVIPETIPIDFALKRLPIDGANFTSTIVLAGIAGRKRSPASDAFVRAARARNWAPTNA